jgi:hypothetical protein
LWGWKERREPGLGGREVAREQKKETEQVYDKNAFATIDNLRKRSTTCSTVHSFKKH